MKVLTFLESYLRSALTPGTLCMLHVPSIASDYLGITFLMLENLNSDTLWDATWPGENWQKIKDV